MKLHYFRNIFVIVLFILAGVVRVTFAQASTSGYIPTITPSSIAESPHLMLKKTVYEIGENITLDYAGEPTPLNIEVKSTQGESIPFQAILRKKGSLSLDVEISKRTKPGKYRLTIKHGDKTLINADIYWGIYLFNSMQNEYKKNEVVVAQLLHFSDDGDILCDSISAPLLTPDKDSSPESAIALHDVCTQDSPSYFEPIFQPLITGDYSYRLPITTDNPEQFTRSIAVVDTSNSIQVKREAPILVKSGSELEYEVKFTLKADSSDFEGTLDELVPANLILTGSNGQNGPSRLTVDENTLKLRYPFGGYFPITLDFGEEPDENHLLEAYHAFGVKAHDGIDFGLSENTPILAADDGQIIEAPLEVAAYGETITIQHSWGRTFYGHLSEKKVHIGDNVRKGDVIGLSGSTGLATGPHLHFGMDLNSMEKENGYLGKIDPQAYLATRHNFATSQKRLSWDINLKANEEKVLSYHVRFPEDGYSIYQLGGLKLKDIQGNEVYEEQKPWNVAKIK